MDDRNPLALPKEFDTKLHRRIRHDLFVKTVFDLTFTAILKVFASFLGLFLAMLSNRNDQQKEIHHE